MLKILDHAHHVAQEGTAHHLVGVKLHARMASIVGLGNLSVLFVQ